jgi:hypothetical protein
MCILRGTFATMPLVSLPVEPENLGNQHGDDDEVADGGD